LVFGFFEDVIQMIITEKITSRNNPTVIAASKLVLRKYREEAGVFTVEGIKLFDEAVAAHAEIKNVFVTKNAFEKYGESIEKSNCEKLFLLTDDVFDKLTSESAPQGIFATVGFYTVPDRSNEDAPFVLVLDGVADPGNLGTIIRCADALGAECVYIGSSGVDLYNPKTVRACMGSLFRVRTERCDAAEKVRELRKKGFSIYAATLDENSRDIRDIDAGGKTGFVIGNEGNGVSPEVAKACDGSVIIPMTSGVQSLNAAVAASIVMWEAAKSRL